MMIIENKDPDQLKRLIYEIENHHLGQHRIRISRYEAKIQDIYANYTDEFISLGLSISDYNPEKLFSFYSYPIPNRRAKKLLTQMRYEILNLVSSGIVYEWEAANIKNDSIVKVIYKKSIPDKYISHNLDALKVFRTRKEGGLNLSGRVWNYTKQYKREIELALDQGLSEGKPAAEVGRNVRRYLREPDRLYRRFRNERGILVPSKAMKMYHPGPGVYRSSAKNALRLTASETNMAYEMSDYTRRNQLDFVVGIEVHTSNNHPIPDMCDDLAGKYPKDFIFRKWHPKCRCHSTSILKTPDEMDRDEDLILEGKPVSGKSVNTVKDVPDGFKKWIIDNEDKIKRAKSKPYFIMDNFKYGNVNKGLKKRNKVLAPQ